jgi:hypothetical protein
MCNIQHLSVRKGAGRVKERESNEEISNRSRSFLEIILWTILVNRPKIELSRQFGAHRLEISISGQFASNRLYIYGRFTKTVHIYFFIDGF